MVELETGLEQVALRRRYGLWSSLPAMLWRDKFALASAIFLLLVFATVLVGPWLLSEPASAMNLSMRNAPPSLENGWLFVLGADRLGRSILARLIVAGQTTMAISAATVFASMLAGSTLGLIAGFRGGWVETAIMRGTDILMSFPSLLLALVVLYALEPRVANVVLVLAVTRMPIYLRTVRAEVLEVRERMFVLAAQVIGAGFGRILTRHIVPIVLPTLVTIATLEFALVMLAESSLSFLGLGVQPPGITWGLMVAEGRNYLASAWWLSFWPGLVIMLTTISLNLLSNWSRMALDPRQRWRLERPSAEMAKRTGSGG
jgi:peptide/nickel transport system permease protein